MRSAAMSRIGFHVILMVLPLCFLNKAGLAAEFAGGTGEPNDPYLIETIDQLLGADFGKAGVHYRFCSDFVLKEMDVILLSRSVSFRAHLDGAGHCLRHAVISSPAGCSLLGIIEPEGAVTNLIVEGAILCFQSSPYHLGVLADENHGTIANCGVTGCVAVSWAYVLGGLVGSNTGSITNCYFEGSVVSEGAPSDWHSVSGIGGLVGGNHAGRIRNCYAKGVVLGGHSPGGLVGANEGSITDCYSTMMVMAEQGGGGLVGDNTGSLTRCYATGWVTGEMKGGLVGFAGQYPGVTTGCFWDKDWTGCSASAGGLGLSSWYMKDAWTYAWNGWAGDPNWVIDDGNDYPHLNWEQATGSPIPDPWPIDFKGSGTLEDPYHIKSSSDLQRLSTASIFWDKHFVLVQDVAFFPSQPIGTCRGSAFAGTFNGNGHKIQSAYIETEGASAWNLGVFGYVTGQVRNLTVESVSITSGPNSRYVGLLAGACEGGLIENCNATGSISVGGNSQYVGQLVGWSTGQIVNCEADVTIKAGEGSTDVGGLIGLQLD